MNLRDMVRQAREEAGLTQEQVSAAVGKSSRWCSAVETGEITSPRVPTLRRLADVLRLDVDDLIIAANLARTKAAARRLAATEPPTVNADEEPMRLEACAIIEGLPYEKLVPTIKYLRTTRRAPISDYQ